MSSRAQIADNFVTDEEMVCSNRCLNKQMLGIQWIECVRKEDILRIRITKKIVGSNQKETTKILCVLREEDLLNLTLHSMGILKEMRGDKQQVTDLTSIGNLVV